MHHMRMLLILKVVCAFLYHVCLQKSFYVLCSWVFQCTRLCSCERAICHHAVEDQEKTFVRVAHVSWLRCSLLCLHFHSFLLFWHADSAYLKN